ncbi:hypothetical protein CRE_22633 [Caenorhabditis remanei]|uniref:Uncharacterized protein n=1 Tax=Caenorhabditis remanei TaxID=31234 RepID=E3N8N9_CAERE|nr:hypothetical protein CRE_22633 [Caenorhabditis remanei]
MTLKKVSTARGSYNSAEIILENPEFRLKKMFHQKELQVLHKMKKASTGQIKKDLEEEIYRKVVVWNEMKRKSPYYFDFHGLTKRGAVRYTKRIMTSMRCNNVSEARIETGRGNHSVDKRPRIKTHLMAIFNQEWRKFSIETEEYNDGILMLRIH